MLDTRQVPFLLGGTPTSGFRTLDADTLSLREDGTFTDVQYVTRGSALGASGNPTPPTFTQEVSTAAGTWTVRGATIALTPNAGTSSYASGVTSGAVHTSRAFELRYTDAYGAAHERTYARP